MRKNATGNAEQAIDAAPAVQPIKTRAAARSVRARATKVTKVTKVTTAAGPSVAAKRPEPPRISLAALAMGTVAVPAGEESPVATKKARPAKAASTVKSAEPVAKAAKVAKVSKTVKPARSANTAKPAKQTKQAKVTTGADAATGTKRPIKGIRLASSLAGLANANPVPFVEEAQEVVPVPRAMPISLAELSLPSLSLATPDPATEIRPAAPAEEVVPPPVLVAARPRPQPSRRWLMPGLALLAIALAGLVVTQSGAPNDDTSAPANGAAAPYGPGPYRPAAYRPRPGLDHGGHYVDNEGRAYGRYGRDSTHW
jgi:hypothetical protein